MNPALQEPSAGAVAGFGLPAAPIGRVPARHAGAMTGIVFARVAASPPPHPACRRDAEPCAL